jgi:hypothetical protein
MFIFKVLKVRFLRSVYESFPGPRYVVRRMCHQQNTNDLEGKRENIDVVLLYVKSSIGFQMVP